MSKPLPKSEFALPRSAISTATAFAGPLRDTGASRNATSRDYLMRELLRAVVKNDQAEALKQATRCVKAFPDDAEFHGYQGDILQREGRLNEALLCYATAMKNDPKNANTLASIGGVLYTMGKNHDAKGFFQAASTLNPHLGVAVSNMVHTSLSESDWSFYADLKRILQVMGGDAISGSPFNLLALTDDPKLQKQRLVRRDQMIRKTVPTCNSFDRTSSESRRVRLGYFSCDFYDHATMFLLGQFFSRHDRDRFEIFIYDHGEKKGSDIQRLVAESADTYRNVQHLSDQKLAELAREDGIDIAIDLKGHTNGNRLQIFTFRAAPVQVSFLGFPGTTGVKEMDYFLGDAVTIPVEQRKNFSEKILYMPDCYQINDNTRKHPKNVTSRAELGLPEDAFVFASLNNPNKITPVEYDVWMQLLHKVENSVLWILAPKQHLKENLAKEAELRGVSSERIVFAERVNARKHLERLPQADLFLDAFNCNAHTTASEALWSGVPLVTKMGKQFAARVAGSVLTAVGCEDLITDSREAYHDLALKLATDRDALEGVRQRLKRNLTTTPLYDTEKFVKNFEDLMEKAIQRYDAGQKPDHISLS